MTRRQEKTINEYGKTKHGKYNTTTNKHQKRKEQFTSEEEKKINPVSRPHLNSILLLVVVSTDAMTQVSHKLNRLSGSHQPQRCVY